jgi:hypothetical protein
MSVRVRKTGKYVTEVTMTVKAVKQKHYNLWYMILDDNHIMGVGKTDKEAILDMLSYNGQKYEKNLRYSPRKRRRKK